MARTPLFGAIKRAMALPTGPRALSRRSFLAMTAALAACQGRAGRGDVAIIGGGAAGLTAAYRLAQAGRNVTLYEASDRLGGRMFTRRDFNADGQFCELGGELVDSNHTALRTLAQELGIEIQRVAPEGGEEFYHFNNRLYTQRDMIGANGQGAFARLAPRIGEDQAALLDADENWTDRARELDAISLRDYLTPLSNLAPSWAMEVLDIAYQGEFGLPTNAQSALNLVDFIGVDTSHGFHVFGESDEAFRIAGGSSSLPDALAARINGDVRVEMQHALASLGRSENGGVRLSFDKQGERIEREHHTLILALPFTKLRQVAGVETLGLSEHKLRTIRELTYGDNSKLMISTHSRPWAQAQWPAPSAGAFYSDIFQLVWETSRGQSGARGILTNFLANQQDRDIAMRTLRQGLQQFSPETLDSLDGDTSVFVPWARQPFVLGSYASASVGQYTTMLEETALPSEDGRIHFAGEHTSIDFLGFMNGAVESGERVAAALLA